METEEPAENKPVVEEPGPEEENVTLEPGMSACLSASDTVFITIFLGTWNAILIVMHCILQKILDRKSVV